MHTEIQNSPFNIPISKADFVERPNTNPFPRFFYNRFPDSIGFVCSLRFDAVADYFGYGSHIDFIYFQYSPLAPRHAEAIRGGWVLVIGTGVEPVRTYVLHSLAVQLLCEGLRLPIPPPDRLLIRTGAGLDTCICVMVHL